MARRLVGGLSYLWSQGMPIFSKVRLAVVCKAAQTNRQGEFGDRKTSPTSCLFIQTCGMRAYRKGDKERKG